MRYPIPHASPLLTSTGTCSLIAIAICACCAAVGYLRRQPAGKGSGLLGGGPRVGRREHPESWESFFQQRQQADRPQGFMSDRVDEAPQKRELF